MIESFTMWRVKDREFTDYSEAVRYENETNEAVKSIEFFDGQGQPLTFEQAQEKEFEIVDFVFIKNEKALEHFEKCLKDCGIGDCPDKIGWNRYDYKEMEWRNFTEEKRAFEQNWTAVWKRIEEEN